MTTILFAGVLFGSIGMGAFVYGKRKSSAAHMLLGALLMGYPYAVSATVPLIGIGIVLTVLLFVFKA